MARSIDIERADARKSDKDKEGHSLGWPHFDSKGNCLCFCWRCFPDKGGGCTCKGCAGHNHENCANGHACGPETCQVPAEAGSGPGTAEAAQAKEGKGAKVLAASA